MHAITLGARCRKDRINFGQLFSIIEKKQLLVTIEGTTSRQKNRGTFAQHMWEPQINVNAGKGCHPRGRGFKVTPNIPLDVTK